MVRSERKALLSTVAYQHAHAGTGFVTVAYVLRWLGAEPARSLQACYGVAWCAPGDTFSRKTGRELALRRLARFLATSASGAIGTIEFDDSGAAPLEPELGQMLSLAWVIGRRVTQLCFSREHKPAWAYGELQFFKPRKKGTRRETK